MRSKPVSLPAPLEIAFRVAIVAGLWAGIFHEWMLSGGGALGLISRCIMLLIITGWAIRAYRFRGQ